MKRKDQTEYYKSRIFEILNNNRKELQTEILRLQNKLEEIDSITEIIILNQNGKRNKTPNCHRAN